MFAAFAIGKGPPSAWYPPEGVVVFVGLFQVALGLIIGWKWEGWAALLIMAGTPECRMVQPKLVLCGAPGALELPLIVGVLYGICWELKHHDRAGGRVPRGWLQWWPAALFIPLLALGILQLIGAYSLRHKTTDQLVQQVRERPDGTAARPCRNGDAAGIGNAARE